MSEMREDAEMKFASVTKEEYESYTPHQRYHLASGNCCSLKELDDEFGVKTDIPDMEAFEEKYLEHIKRTSKMVLNDMYDEGCFDGMLNK